MNLNDWVDCIEHQVGMSQRKRKKKRIEIDCLLNYLLNNCKVCIQTNEKLTVDVDDDSPADGRRDVIARNYADKTKPMLRNLIMRIH